MVKVAQSPTKATSTAQVDRAKLPGTMDLIAAIREVAGCEPKDYMVEVERHTAASGSEVYGLYGQVLRQGIKYMVSVNVTVAGTKTK